MKNNKRLPKLIICLMLSCMLAGCGNNKSNPNVAEGMKAIEELRYNDALICFEAATVNKEDSRLISRGKGIASMGVLDYETAITCLEECLFHSKGKVSDMDYDINYYLAAAYCKSGEYSEAEQVYSAILDMRPEEADAYYLRGNARLEQGQFEKAKADFDKLIELLPNDFDKLIKIYEVLESHRYKEIGQEYLQEALNNRVAKMGAYDKGRINYYLGEYQQAYLSLEEAKKLDTPEVYLYLGKAYEATGDYNYAINNVYTTYLNKHMGNALIYNQLGLCYMNQKNYELALSAFQSAMNMESNEIMQTLYFNEVVAYEFLGEYTKAAALLDSYLQTYPDDEVAKREYGFLITR